MSWFFGSANAQNQANDDYKLHLAEIDHQHKERLAEAENATKQRIAEAENATKLRLAEICSNEKEIAGGIGGKGGKSLKLGGDGGFGQGTRLTIEEAMRYRRITGGIGGEGGEGDHQGGNGGVGGRPMFEKPLVSPVHGEVPNLTTAGFCKQYRLSAHICKLLENGGFETAEGLVNVTTTGAAEVGLKPGHIAELTRALKKFVAEKYLFVLVQTFSVEYISGQNATDSGVAIWNLNLFPMF
ncbi:hypothetical protein DFH07DRAFT_980646 [Mycena maculata]|uniref:Uncharacterized protein n=1 Tax=Mycena maculata TaxID=230809 RepID=A0AAD7K3Q9_9AGAR|nr:hypothetical protein DFH07DRAFT_980646 [Mycena maculata]